MSSKSHDRSRANGTQRAAWLIVGAAIVAVVGWMTYEADGARPAVSARPVGAAASVATTASTAPAAVDAGPSIANMDESDAGLFLPALSLGDAAVMPSTAPRHVKIGVVLVAFAGAEGAPPTARSKKDALAIADRLGADAKSDFHRAVSAGDPGSADDIGRLPRGVLDPRTEVSVFALAPGEVSEVLETPRGYWIVKRID